MAQSNKSCVVIAQVYFILRFVQRSLFKSRKNVSEIPRVMKTRQPPVKFESAQTCQLLHMRELELSLTFNLFKHIYSMCPYFQQIINGNEKTEWQALQSQIRLVHVNTSQAVKVSLADHPANTLNHNFLLL